MRYKIVFWEPIVSPHKVYLVDKLSKNEHVESVTYVADTSLHSSRRDMGWPDLSNELMHFWLRPSDREINELLDKSDRETIHLFSGIRHVPTIERGLREVLKRGSRFAILSEPRVFEGIKGWLRLVQSLTTERNIRRHASFVLAIGRNGPSWFRAAMYSKAKIFPYAYFIPKMSDTFARNEHLRGNVKSSHRVAFIGRLEREKGIHLFLDYVRNMLNNETLEFHIVGSGSEAAAVEALASDSLGRLKFHNTLKMSEIGNFLNTIDVLVAPSISKNDGWGVVVSEALLCGTAVVASRQVGASICLEEELCGELMRDLTSNAIEDAVKDIVSRPDRTDDAARQLRIQWANRRLTDEAGAEYLVAVLDHVFCGALAPLSMFEGSCGVRGSALGRDVHLC